MQVPVGAAAGATGDRRGRRPRTPRSPLDDDGRLSAPAPSPRRRPSPCGGPRPTTTGSAGWRPAGPRPGVDRLERRLVGIERDGADDRRPQRRTRPRTGIESRTRPTYTLLADGAIRIDETVEHPRRARRPRRASGPSSRSRPATRRCAGSAPGRTRPTRTGSAAGLVGHWESTVDRPVRPVHPAAGERRPRRRPLARARATRPAPASGSTSTSRARSRSRTIAPPTSPRRPTTSTSSAIAETIVHLDAAHRGLGTASCGPDTLPEYRLGTGHATAGRGRCATSATA